jgi:hypothetical protein
MERVPGATLRQPHGLNGRVSRVTLSAPPTRESDAELAEGSAFSSAALATLAVTAGVPSGLAPRSVLLSTPPNAGAPFGDATAEDAFMQVRGSC